MLFDIYFRDNGRIQSVQEINQRELFFLPANMNPHYSKHIKFGKHDITKVIQKEGF